MSFDRMTEAQYADYMRRQAKMRVARVLVPELDRVFNAATVPPPPKSAKYRNTRVDGFDSIKERDVWTVLEARARVGEISELQRQVKFALVVNGIHVCDYVADYVWREGERRVVADTKSVMTRKLPVYRIKFKLMQACHAITLDEL